MARLILLVQQDHRTDKGHRSGDMTLIANTWIGRTSLQRPKSIHRHGVIIARVLLPLTSYSGML